MAVREPCGGVEFGHGPAELGEEEEGIVAEAGGSARRVEDFAFDDAVGESKDLAVADGGEGAAIAGRIRGGRDGGECGEEAGVVALIRGEAGAWWVTCIVGVAGGADAGCSVEGVDLEAGVVGENDRAGRVGRIGKGFDAGVTFEGEFIFGGGRDGGEAGEGFDGDAGTGGGGKVAEFAGVGGGDVEGLRQPGALVRHTGSIGFAATGFAAERGESMGSMKAYTEYLTFTTEERYEMVHITPQVEQIVRQSGVVDGLCFVSPMHITAAIYVNDNEDGLIEDIGTWLEKLAPSQLNYKHHQTGEDNADAHLKALLLHHETTLPITKGRLDLGTWQRIFYAEFDGQRRKRVIVKVLGVTEG
jgi:secondary thiamine-phosphate synthase enzyme